MLTGVTTGSMFSSSWHTSLMVEKSQNSIIDLIPNHSIFWKDRNSVYLGCNAALATSLGFQSTADIIGKTDFDLPTIKRSRYRFRKRNSNTRQTNASDQ